MFKYKTNTANPASRARIERLGRFYEPSAPGDQKLAFLEIAEEVKSPMLVYWKGPPPDWAKWSVAAHGVDGDLYFNE